MYSSGKVAVDKGLGFDFSMISDLVKTALPTGLQLYSQQMQVNQLKATGGYPQPYPMQSAAQYLVPGQLPMSQVMQSRPTFGGGAYAQPSTGMDVTTMALIGGGVLVAAVVLLKVLK
jgi:hypothetical protein